MNREEYIKLAALYLDDLDRTLKTAAAQGLMGLDYTEEKLASFKWLMTYLDTEEIAELDKTAAESLDAMEKLAAWNASMEILAEMEKDAWAGQVMRGIAGVAGKLYGGASKLLGGAGRVMGGVASRMGGRGAQLAEYAAQPSKRFTSFLTQRRGADFAQAASEQIRGAGGLRGWVQQRRMAERAMAQVPGTGVRAGLKGPAAAPAISQAVPGTAQMAGAGAITPGSRGAEAVRRYREVLGPEGAGRHARLSAPGKLPAAPGQPAPGTTGTAAGGNGSAWKDIGRQARSGAAWGAGFGALNWLLSPREQPEVRMVGG
jgi:hypothetical protein